MPSDEKKQERVLYERLGGEGVVVSAIEFLYSRILADNALNAFFEGADIESLKRHQLVFLRSAFTEIPAKDRDAEERFMLTKHERLFDVGLNESHFDAMLGHFSVALGNIQVRPYLIEEAVGALSGFRTAFARGAAEARRRMSEIKPRGLRDRLADHIDDEEIADVILRGNDGGTVPACRFLLAARSRVFRRMLFGSFKESTSDVVEINYGTSVLRAVVEFCYTDEIGGSRGDDGGDENSARTAVQLVTAARFFEIPELGKAAYEYACSVMRRRPPLAGIVLDESARAGEPMRPDLISEAEDLVHLDLKSPLLPSVRAKEQFLLHRLGGEPVLTAAIDEFYVEVLTDKSLEPFFGGVNLKSLKKHQARFMQMAFTVIPDWEDAKNLIFAKHSRLFEIGLNEEHFDAMISHFQEALAHLRIKDDLIREAVDVLTPLRNIFEQGAEKYR